MANDSRNDAEALRDSERVEIVPERDRDKTGEFWMKPKRRRILLSLVGTAVVVIGSVVVSFAIGIVCAYIAVLL